MNEILTTLKAIAAQKSPTDCEECFNPYDASDGNFDDAFGLGQEDGEISLARRLLEMWEEK